MVNLRPDLLLQPYLVQGTDTATGQNVGLLTRIDPIVAMQRYQEGKILCFSLSCSDILRTRKSDFKGMGFERFVSRVFFVL